jgi:hypothetical protein
MSSAYVFYSSSKTVKIPPTVDSPYKSVIPLANHKVFFGFPSGHWILYDAAKEQAIKEGQIKGDSSTHLTLFRSPKALDNKTIIFSNASLFKLQALNPETGELDPTWEFDAPTFEGLPQDVRSNETKVDSAYSKFELHLLTETKIVGVLERKENAQGVEDFLVTAYQHGKKDRLVQVSLPTQNKPMSFANGNDKDTFILYPITQYENFSIYVLNVNKPDQGLQTVTVNTKIEAALYYLFPWTDNSIVLFGNPDEGGTPYMVTHKLGSDKVDIQKMKCNRYDATTLLDNVLAADPAKNRVLLKDNNGPHGCAVAVWNAAVDRVEFSREQNTRVNAVSSTDGTYFVEFEGDFQNKEKEAITFTFNRLVSKKMFLLHFMKQATFKGKPLIEIHGKIDVLRDVASMF